MDGCRACTGTLRNPREPPVTTVPRAAAESNGRQPAPALQKKVIVGLDIGGSKTHGVRIDGGRVTRNEVAGSANVQNVDQATAAANVGHLMFALGGLDADEVYVGAGGIDTKEDAANLRKLISPMLPGPTWKLSTTPGSSWQQQARTQG